MHRSPRLARRLLGILATGMFVLTGCGAPPGRDTGNSPSPVPPEPVPMAPVSDPALPPRPYGMPLHGLDPCELISERQRARLGFNRDPLPGVEPGFGDAATCSFRNSHAKVGARLALVTIEGMDVWTSDTAQVLATPTTIGGFPALVIRTPQLELACNVAVDVAEGQHLDVLYRDDGGDPPPPLGRLCAGAKRVARAAVTSLKQVTAETSPGTDP